MHPLLTINGSTTENYPFAQGEQVEVHWELPSKRIEHATIVELKTGIQHGKQIVYCVMITTEKHKRPFAVSAAILKKLTQNQNGNR